VKLRTLGVAFGLVAYFVLLVSCSKQASTSSSTVNSSPATQPSPPTSTGVTSRKSENLNKVTSPEITSRTPTPKPPLDEATKARIDKIKRETIPILASFAQPERFTVEQRRKLLIKGLDKGWPAMLEDLQFVVDHLAPDDPEREGFKALLEVTKKVVNKGQ